MPAFSRSTEATVRIDFAAETVFAYLDDHRHLGAHMSASSWMMLGSKMDYEFDAGSSFGRLQVRIPRKNTRNCAVCRSGGCNPDASQTEGMGNHRSTKPLGNRPLSHGLRDRPRGGILPASGLHRLRPAGQGAGMVARYHLCECLCTLVHGTDGERRSKLFPEDCAARSPVDRVIDVRRQVI